MGLSGQAWESPSQSKPSRFGALQSGPVKFLSSPAQPTLGQPPGRIEYGGKTYRPSHSLSLQLRSHSPYRLQ
jgi:hypothetical protein